MSQQSPSFKAGWIAADWGTSRLRVWAMSESGAILAMRETAEGMGGLASSDFEDRLLKAADGWLASGKVTLVVVCGMAGAREGWADAGYRPVPVRVAEGALSVQAPAHDPRLDVRILSGVSQAHPADVMRGEETQIAGLLQEKPEFDGLVILPGTHTKWALIGEGAVQSFSTCMTGEIFHLLSTQSILRHSVDSSDGWDWPQFDRAFDLALRDPAGVTSRLFSLRAESLLRGFNPSIMRARLSAELIAVEIASQSGKAQGRRVMLIGAEGLCELYRRALVLAGIETQTRAAEAMTLAGLTAAWKRLKDA